MIPAASRCELVLEILSSVDLHDHADWSENVRFRVMFTMEIWPDLRIMINEGFHLNISRIVIVYSYPANRQIIMWFARTTNSAPAHIYLGAVTNFCACCNSAVLLLEVWNNFECSMSESEWDWMQENWISDSDLNRLSRRSASCTVCWKRWDFNI